MLASLLAAGVYSLWWAAFSESGSAWLLSKVPGLVIVKPKGALGGDFQAERVELTLANGDKLVLGAVGWRGLSVSRFGNASPYLRIVIDALYAQRVDYVAPPKPKTDKPLLAPASLRLPFELEIKSLAVGEVHAAALRAQPLRALSAALHLGADGGALHRVDALSLTLGPTARGRFRAHRCRRRQVPLDVPASAWPRKPAPRWPRGVPRSVWPAPCRPRYCRPPCAPSSPQRCPRRPAPAHHRPRPSPGACNRSTCAPR